MQSLFYNKKSHLKCVIYAPWIACVMIVALFSSVRLQAQQFTFKKHPLSIEGFENAQVTRMLESSTGWLYLASAKGLLQYNGLNFNALATESPVTALYEDRQKRLWCGLKNGDIFYFEKQKLHQWIIEEGTPKVAITGFAEDKNGYLWFATYGEGVYYHDKKHLYNINTDDGLTGNDVYCMMADSEGTMWFGTDDGISIGQVEKGIKKAEKWAYNNDLPDLIIRTLSLDKQGTMWLGTHDKGFCTFDRATRKITYLIATNGKRHPLDLTMDKVENMVSPKQFFRINRQFIISVNAIVEMHAHSKSRVKVVLNPPAKEEAVVSAEKSADFKRWLTGEN